MKRIYVGGGYIYFMMTLFSYNYALIPVDLIPNDGFDLFIKKYDRFLEWDTGTTGGVYDKNVKFKLQEVDNYSSYPHSASIDTKENADGSYEGFIVERFILPKKARDLIKLSWKNYLLYKEDDYNKTYGYFISLAVSLDSDSERFFPFLSWIFLRDTTEEFSGPVFKFFIPQDKKWCKMERNLKDDFSIGINLDTEFDAMHLESMADYDNGLRGQKVYWDDIKLIGWADYNRALTRIVSGIPEKDKPYRAEVMLWNNGRNHLSTSKVRMLVIKDEVDTLYNRDQLCFNMASDDSSKISFSSWIPTEDGNYRIEFYTGYLWSKYFGHDLAIDECDDDDYLVMEFTLGVREDNSKVVEWIKQSNKYIDLNIGIEGKLDVSLYDIEGRKVAGIYSGYVDEGERISYDWEDLCMGIYFIKVKIGNKEFTKRIIKIW